MQVRVRCVGDQGSGHGSYSTSVSFKTPGNREPVSKPPSVMSEASSQGGPDSKALTTTSSSRRQRASAAQGDSDGLPPSYPSGGKGDTVKIRKKGGECTTWLVTGYHHCIVMQSCILQADTSSLLDLCMASPALQMLWMPRMSCLTLLCCVTSLCVGVQAACVHDEHAASRIG